MDIENLVYICSWLIKYNRIIFDLDIIDSQLPIYDISEPTLV